MNTGIEVKLPSLMWEEDLAKELRKNHIINDEGLIIPQCHLILNWHDVRFFEDIALLKLIIIEHHLRYENIRVKHIGFKDNYRVEGVLRQLFLCGYLELLASSQLWNPTKEIAEDLDELLSSFPVIDDFTVERPTVMRIVACHRDDHFERTSRESRRIAKFTDYRKRMSFIESVESSSLKEWELIHTGAFRSLILEQMRRNVQEHAGASLGLSCARILSPSTFDKEWQIAGSRDSFLKELISCNTRLAIKIRDEFANGNTLIYTATVDNGYGIPKTISEVPASKKILHTNYLSEILDSSRKEENKERINGGLFVKKKNYFHHRFEKATKDWNDNHRLLAFATDPKGTKKERYPGSEKKGLTTLVDIFVMENRGILKIESGTYNLSFEGDSINDIDRQQHLSCKGEGEYRCYGTPNIPCLPCNFKNKDGSLVLLTTTLGKLVDINETITEKGPVSSASKTKDISRNIQHIDVISIWNNTKGEDRAKQCAVLLKEKALLSGTSQMLCIYDWSEMRLKPGEHIDDRIDKAVLNRILYEFAQSLSQLETNKMAALVFAHFPEEMLPLLNIAIKGFPDLMPPPICLFTTGSREPKWLWLDCNPDSQDYICAELNSILAPNQTKPRKSAISIDWQSKAHKLMMRCPLFQSSQLQYGDGDIYNKYDFTAQFTLDDITAAIQEIFLDRLRIEIENNTIIHFHDNANILLPKSPHGCVVDDYYRCDALVDNPIADELAETLTQISYGFANEAPNKKVDYIISCTSPTHWFVHQIVDGLHEYGMEPGHYVFASPSSIKTEIDNTGIQEGHNVIVFTDVISTGSLVLELVKYVKSKNAHLAGLISIIDTRDQSISSSDPIVDVFDKRVAIMLTLPVAKNTNKKAIKIAKWRVHRDTATPTLRKAKGSDQLYAYYHSEVFDGIGDLKHCHGFWKNVNFPLRHLNAMNALMTGHFHHGSHHSTLYCDIWRAFKDTALKEAFVSAIFWYIIKNGINLVICPNDSGIYLIKDELALRFPPLMKNNVIFATASRINTAEHGYTYILTTLNSEFRGTWPKDIENILLIDDGIVSGETMRSLITEVVSAHRNSALKSKNAATYINSTVKSIHITAFVNRLTDRQTKFFRELETFTNQHFNQKDKLKNQNPRILFSTLFSLPIKAYPEDACPICQRLKHISEIINNKDTLSSIQHFYSEWQHDLKVLNSHESPSMSNTSSINIEGEDAYKISSALIAINDGEIDLAKKIAKQLPFTSGCHIDTAILDNFRDLRMGYDDRFLAIMELIEKAKKELSDTDEINVEYRICISLIRIIVGNIIDYPLVSSNIDNHQKLGGELITVAGQYLHNDHILYGLAAFITACLTPLKRKTELTIIQKYWIEGLDKLPSDNKNNDNIAWIKHLIHKPDSRLSSVGNAVFQLNKINSKMKAIHAHPREAIESVYSVSNEVDASIKFKIQGEDGELLRRALVTFDEIIQCVRIIGVGGTLSKIKLAILLNCDSKISTLRHLSDPGYIAEQCNKSMKSNLIKQILKEYRSLYNIWFPESEDTVAFESPTPPILDILNRFKVNLKDCWNEAWNNACHKEVINLGEMTALDCIVLCERSLLVDLFGQYLQNLWKHKTLNSEIRVFCKKEYLPKDVNVFCISLMNKGTLSKNNSPNGGLTEYKWLLEQYGGEIEWGNNNKNDLWQVKLTFEI